MAALAEPLVDEWLNRQGFFTVRGIKHGVDEVDLLAVRPSRKQRTKLEAWHVEVQASFRPVGYITPIPSSALQGFAKSKTSAKKRPRALIESAVAGWVNGKFTSSSKHEVRERAWPNLKWRHVFVHAVVREPEELRLIESHDVEVIPLHQVLAELGKGGGVLRGGAGTDLSEIIEYFYANSQAASAGT